MRPAFVFVVEEIELGNKVQLTLRKTATTQSKLSFSRTFHSPLMLRAAILTFSTVARLFIRQTSSRKGKAEVVCSLSLFPSPVYIYTEVDS